MPFRLPEGQPDFATLQQYLANSGYQQKNPALYQTIKLLIEWLSKLQAQENAAIEQAASDLAGLVAIIQELLLITFLTTTDATTLLPNSRVLLAGEKIEFDDTVAGERTINASASGSYIPLAVGEEPLAFVSDGAGQPILVDYNP